MGYSLHHSQNSPVGTSPRGRAPGGRMSGVQGTIGSQGFSALAHPPHHPSIFHPPCAWFSKSSVPHQNCCRGERSSISSQSHWSFLLARQHPRLSRCWQSPWVKPCGYPSQHLFLQRALPSASVAVARSHPSASGCSSLIVPAVRIYSSHALGHRATPHSWPRLRLETPLPYGWGVWRRLLSNRPSILGQFDARPPPLHQAKLGTGRVAKHFNGK